jgi:hypothetical protein
MAITHRRLNLVTWRCHHWIPCKILHRINLTECSRSKLIVFSHWRHNLRKKSVISKKISRNNPTPISDVINMPILISEMLLIDQVFKIYRILIMRMEFHFGATTYGKITFISIKFLEMIHHISDVINMPILISEMLLIDQVFKIYRILILRMDFSLWRHNLRKNYV